MKTQLLEDIGQSAPLSLTPTLVVGNSTAAKAVPEPVAQEKPPARARAGRGVWRQKPADEPAPAPAHVPDPQPTPLDLHDVFDEIAALEAQYVHPERQDVPGIAPAVFEELAPPPAAPAPPEPVFDFTPPAPARQSDNPFAPAAPTRSRQRYLLWGAGLLATSLLLLGGRWVVQERSDSAALARITDAASPKPFIANAVPPPVPAPMKITAAPVEAVATPTLPPSSVPPLVMLEPDPPAAKPEPRPAPAPAPDKVARPKPRKLDAAPKQATASSLPKRASRPARTPPHAASKPATKTAAREPVRQLARASAIERERAAGPEMSVAATLKACRERGYHATQCVKRGCSVTEYGFACRGR